jgi:hypothetical protein
MLKFDASITIGPHHFIAGGLEGRHKVVLDAVRKAVRAIEGADWIDVAAQNYPPECPGWVTLYQAGHSGPTPDTPALRDLHKNVEAVALAAMVAAGAPF